MPDNWRSNSTIIDEMAELTEISNRRINSKIMTITESDFRNLPKK